jgi:hypothetical protein
MYFRKKSIINLSLIVQIVCLGIAGIGAHRAFQVSSNRVNDAKIAYRSGIPQRIIINQLLLRTLRSGGFVITNDKSPD